MTACAPAPGPKPAPASSSEPTSIDASPSASAFASASAAQPELTLRVHKRTPVACNAAQTNVPCIYKKSRQCLLRTSNCSNKPCTEGIHQPVACDSAIAGLAKPLARVCLDVMGMADQTMIRVYQEDSASETGYGPSPRTSVRLCAHDGADRPWKIEVDDGNATKLEATLDWAKGTCATLDLAAKTVKMGCAEPFKGTPIEGRL